MFFLHPPSPTKVTLLCHDSLRVRCAQPPPAFTCTGTQVQVCAAHCKVPRAGRGGGYDHHDYPHLPHHHSHNGVEMTHLLNVTPRFILRSFQPLVLFHQLIQFIPVSVQVFVIRAHVHFVKPGH